MHGRSRSDESRAQSTRHATWIERGDQAERVWMEGSVGRIPLIPLILSSGQHKKPRRWAGGLGICLERCVPLSPWRVCGAGRRRRPCHPSMPGRPTPPRGAVRCRRRLKGKCRTDRWCSRTSTLCSRRSSGGHPQRRGMRTCQSQTKTWRTDPHRQRPHESPVCRGGTSSQSRSQFPRAVRRPDLHRRSRR